MATLAKRIPDQEWVCQREMLLALFYKWLSRFDTFTLYLHAANFAHRDIKPKVSFPISAAFTRTKNRY